MNKTKFRAWDEDEKRMIYSSEEDYLDEDGYEHLSATTVFPTIDGKIAIHFYSNNGTDEVRFINGKIMQCIGHKSHGKEIYEGDIMLAGLPAEVIFKDGAFFMYRKDMPEGALVSDILEEFPCKIIGNIYENPELLK